MKQTKKTIAFVLIFLHVVGNFALPADSSNSLVVTSTEPSSDKKDDSPEVNLIKPQIYQMHVKSNISNRFAHTTIISKVKNAAQKAQEATFSIILPENAFISGFVMEVDGKNYTAYVKEKEEARKTYDRALESGLGAAHVAVSARDSNRFTVSVNVEPESKAAFYLTYEELLKRQDGRYELVINLHPGQPVKDLNVEVTIAESRKITDLRAPPLRSGNEIANEKAELDPRADIEVVNDTSAVVRFTPNLERQKQLAHLLGTDEKQGLAGQFVVQYDVERDPQGGEVLIQDGYFVHFFAPSELAPLPKHVVFVLDTSSSMYGQKIEQLKQAMHKILEQLHSSDLFSFVEFNTDVKVWDINHPASSVSCHTWTDSSSCTLPGPYLANEDNIKKAKDIVTRFSAESLTNIHIALEVGLLLVELGRNQDTDGINRQPMMIFLTDGEPTVGLMSTKEISDKISEFNSGSRKAPIYALSFGTGADKSFLQKLALRNSGFAKHIYEAADASLQLQEFYKQISSPLLVNVTFKYEPSVVSLTTAEFPIHYRGSELVVAGCYDSPHHISPTVDAWTGPKIIVFNSTVQRSVSNIERLWAYLTVKQLLDRKEVSDEDTGKLKQKALDLALKYSFVTSVSSLVVVKPNATDAVNTEAADTKKPQYRGSSPGTQFHSASIAPASYPSYGYGGRHGIRAFHSHHFLRLGGGGGGGGYYPMSQPRIPISLDPPQIATTVIPATSQSPVATETSEIIKALPWLKDVLDENGILNLPVGNYKLGLNETLSDDVICSKTPLGGGGHCKLLNSCKQIHSLLTDVNIFIQHFCPLPNDRAGVCCPDSS